MNFKNRIDFKSYYSSEYQALTIEEFAFHVFKKFVQGFVVMGYGKESHAKFLIMKGDSLVYVDAFKPFKNTFIGWINLVKEQFPDKVFEPIKIPFTRDKAVEGIENLDQAVNRFSIATDAFLMFGYSGNERVVKSYASDPLKADAISFLKAMAMNLWEVEEGENK